MTIDPPSCNCVSRLKGGGFTLLEVLVALAIFAVSALVLLQQSGRSARQLYELENRTLASWIAENELTRIRLAAEFPPVGNDETELRFGGRAWMVRTGIETTTRADLRRVDVEIFQVADTDQRIYQLTGFVGRY